MDEISHAILQRQSGRRSKGHARYKQLLKTGKVVHSYLRGQLPTYRITVSTGGGKWRAREWSHKSQRFCIAPAWSEIASRHAVWNARIESAHRLMGRRTKSLLPTLDKNLHPLLVNPHEVSSCLERWKTEEKAAADRGKKTPLTFCTNDKVMWHRSSRNWVSAEVVGREGSSNSYIIQTKDGNIYRRNSWFLRTRVDRDDNITPNLSQPRTSSQQKLSVSELRTSVQPSLPIVSQPETPEKDLKKTPDSRDLGSPQPDSSPSKEPVKQTQNIGPALVTTSRGRVVKPPKRFTFE